jgi:hydrogenase maturation protein HypF
VWGGEFLRLGTARWERVAALRPFRLPGGEAAVREPRRAALGLLQAAFGDDAFAMADLPPVAAFEPAARNVLRTMLARGVNAPLTSSIGRLFDAVAALGGLRQVAGYEGQAASQLEWAADGVAAGSAYAFPLREMPDGHAVLDWQPALEALLADLRAGGDAGAISAALHRGLAAAVVAVAIHAGEERVVLSGGCFQNVRLIEAAVAALRAAGFAPLWHRSVPPNDGGIALGQAAWACWTGEGDMSCA